MILIDFWKHKDLLIINDIIPNPNNANIENVYHIFIVTKKKLIIISKISIKILKNLIFIKIELYIS